jgi:hypothetical protein
MKRTIFVLLTMAALAMTTGCLHRQCRDNGCQSGNCPQAEACTADDCGHHCCLFGRHRAREAAPEQAAQPGPQSAAVAYPYYNLRGPRDFLERNPQSIGP